MVTGFFVRCPARLRRCVLLRLLHLIRHNIQRGKYVRLFRVVACVMMGGGLFGALC